MSTDSEPSPQASFSQPLTVLLTNVWLESAGGTECVVREVARGLQARGHRPIVYSPHLGEFARTIRDSGIAVVDDLEAVTEVPDIIHGHHFIPTAEAIIRFPETPAFHVCHSWRFWVEQPPLFPQIRLHAGVNETIVNQLVAETGLPAARVTFLPNAVDLQRFIPRQRPWPAVSPRLLAFHGGGMHHPFIREAAARLRLPLITLGRGGDRTTDTPEVELQAHDIVFATGRAALEAMASGCAVIVCGEAGMAGLVTPENFSWYRRCNFAASCFIRPVSTEALVEEIQACEPVKIAQVSAMVREVASLDAQLDRIEAIYRQILRQAAEEPVSPASYQTALRKFLSSALPRLPQDKRWPWQEEQIWMNGEIARWKSHHSAAEAHLAEASLLVEELREELEQARRLAEVNAQLSNRNDQLARELALLRGSRSWRLTRPLRRLRGLRSWR